MVQPSGLKEVNLAASLDKRRFGVLTEDVAIAELATELSPFGARPEAAGM